MGIITISLEDESERKLREIATKKYGKKKGYISKTLIDAIIHLEKNLNGERAEERLMMYAEEGLHLGKINSKKLREEIYNGRSGSI